MTIVLTTIPGRMAPIAMHHWEEISLYCTRRKQQIGQFHWPTGENELPPYFSFQRCLLLLGLAPLPFLRVCVFHHSYR
jgi:hypothetical protein